jgi:hypothetical protein
MDRVKHLTGLPLDRRDMKTFLISGRELDVDHEPAPWHELHR